MALPPLTRTEQALHFAEMNRRSNEFCKKIAKQFEYLGYITQAQVEAVLRIKEQQNARQKKAYNTPPVM